jgi:hypothetical protein
MFLAQNKQLIFLYTELFDGTAVGCSCMFAVRYCLDLLNKIQAKFTHHQSNKLCKVVGGVLFGCCTEEHIASIYSVLNIVQVDSATTGRRAESVGCMAVCPNCPIQRHIQLDHIL